MITVIARGRFHKDPDLFIFVTVVLVGLTLKTTYILFGSTLLAIIYFKGAGKNSGYFGWALFFAVMAPYFIDNVLISGYLFYPSSLAPLAGWKVL